MKITVGELLKVKQGLVALLDIPVSSAAIGYRVQHNLRKIENELGTYTEVSQALFKEHLAVGEDGKPVQLEGGGGYLLKKEGAEEFHRKNNELAEEICEISLQKFTFEELDKFDESLTANIMSLIEILVNVEDGKEQES